MTDLLSISSIRNKVAGGVLAFLIAVSLFVAVYFPIQRQESEEESLLTHCRSMASIAAAEIAPAVAADDTESVAQFVSRYGQAAHARYVVIAGPKGAVLAAYNLQNAEFLGYNQDGYTSGEACRGSALIAADGTTLGMFHLGITPAATDAEISSFRATTWVLAITLLIAGSILTLALTHMLTKPVASIVTATERAAGGDLNARAESPFNDDLGKLAHAINTIIMNTDAAFKRVEGVTKILEKRDQQLKHASDELELIEKQIQLSDEIINKVSALIIVSNASGGIEYASPSFETVLGYRQEDLLRDGWWKVVKGDGIERMKEKGKAARLARGEHKVSETPYERQIIDAKGQLRWILWQDTPGLNNTLIGVGQDITERKLAEEQILEQAALLDITGDAIIVRTLEHRILYWNKGAETLYGWPTDDAVGKEAQTLFKQESAAGIGSAYASVIENGAWSGEMKQETRDGRTIIVESRWTLMNDEHGKPKSILVVNTDVTEQRQMEVQFRRAQRLENIGTLAGGIAHDLNNVLTPILMSIQALQKRHTDEKTQQLLATVDLSARRGADIVKQVLTFARGNEGERSLLQPKHLLREIEKITRETFPRSIEIKTHLPADLWTVIGDATQLHQIVLNLLVNARDAMPAGGTLTLAAKNVTLDDDEARKHLTAKPGAYVVFAVSDTGTGIPPAVVDKIFDPFFTTKEVGKGTGLGLSTVMAIVKSYNGFILVDTEIGKGTQFAVHIPATNVGESEFPKEGRLELPSGRGEGILVVDDERTIRDMTKETLEAYGYRIETAKDGVDALTLIEKDINKFHLVLTDMMMPTMDGGSLIRTLRRLAPHIKIVAVSGITDQEVLDKIKKSKIEAFLPKPIQTDNLLKILDSVLHGDKAEV